MTIISRTCCLLVLTTAEYSYMKSDYFFKNSFFPKPPKIMNFSKTLGQYSMSKPFPFYIPIIIHIQATQAGRSTWLFCTGWLVMRTKTSMVMIMGMRSKTDL